VAADGAEGGRRRDCILWAMPEAIRAWLEEEGEGEGAGFVIAEDVGRCYGRFDALCGPGARNSGIRGLPAGFDLVAAFEETLRARPGVLGSETEEQGLQVATLERSGTVRAVRSSEVTICVPGRAALARVDGGELGAPRPKTPGRRGPASVTTLRHDVGAHEAQNRGEPH
jgi:hypothetical protein